MSMLSYTSWGQLMAAELSPEECVGVGGHLLAVVGRGQDWVAGILQMVAVKPHLLTLP